MNTPRPIILLTDFGLTDPYVGQMKAAILKACPLATIMDLSHGVEPFNLAQAGFFLASSWPWFPVDSVFVAVVDPGVGTDRKIIGVSAHDRVFIAPDNGLLSLVLEQARSEPLKAYDFTPIHLSGEISATFHGRDIFAPIAGRIAAGERPEQLGSVTDPACLVRLPWSSPCRTGNTLKVHVLHIDHFGNIILNLPVEPWIDTLRSAGSVAFADCRVVAAARTYSDIPADVVAAVAGSQGFIELSMFMRSAAEATGLRAGQSLDLVLS